MSGTCVPLGWRGCVTYRRRDGVSFFLRPLSLFCQGLRRVHLLSTALALHVGKHENVAVASCVDQDRRKRNTGKRANRHGTEWHGVTATLDHVTPAPISQMRAQGHIVRQPNTIRAQKRQGKAHHDDDSRQLTNASAVSPCHFPLVFRGLLLFTSFFWGRCGTRAPSACTEKETRNRGARLAAPASQHASWRDASGCLRWWHRLPFALSDRRTLRRAASWACRAPWRSDANARRGS